ncbi:MAG: serine/threonine protein kinase, partial [Lentisphaeraceae bacterium]|nr:serine/threonine protein kinase [Lentisphaeraceae bacterium]
MDFKIDSDKLANILEGKYLEAKEEYLDKNNLASITDQLKTPEDRYCNESSLAKGGMKEIFKVYDQLTDRELAMAKPIVKDDSDTNEYFLREARITASLQHPNIMPIYDIGSDENGEVFFTMALFNGKNLAEILFAPENKITNIKKLHANLSTFLKICDAVSHAHDKGIIHLDIKPDNIQIGEHGQVLLCDWGVSKILFHECKEEILFKKDLESANLNMTLLNRGTPGYMAPEQFVKKQQTDRLTDLYALGGLLYSILTYEKPINEKSLEGIKNSTIKGDIREPSKRSPENYIPSSLEAICMKALSVKKEQRYQSISELTSEVYSYLNGFASQAENASFGLQVKLFVKRNKKIVSILTIALLTLLFSSSYFILELRGKEKMTAKALNRSLISEKKTKETLFQLQKEIETRIEAEEMTSKRFTKQA